MAFFGWAVLFLVFVDELLAIAAAATWGDWAAGGWFAALVAVATAVGWYLFASPKARFGGPVSRELGKATVYTLTTAGLWVSGHHDLAIAFLAFSLVINAFAQLPSIRVLVQV
jgi:hypothetical protein